MYHLPRRPRFRQIAFPYRPKIKLATDCADGLCSRCIMQQEATITDANVTKFRSLDSIIASPFKVRPCTSLEVVHNLTIRTGSTCHILTISNFSSHMCYQESTYVKVDITYTSPLLVQTEEMGEISINGYRSNLTTFLQKLQPSNSQAEDTISAMEEFASRTSEAILVTQNQFGFEKILLWSLLLGLAIAVSFLYCWLCYRFIRHTKQSRKFGKSIPSGYQLTQQSDMLVPDPAVAVHNLFIYRSDRATYDIHSSHQVVVQQQDQHPCFAIGNIVLPLQYNITLAEVTPCHCDNNESIFVTF